MALASVNSRALDGLAAPPVAVEVHVSGGLPALSIVGLPEAAVRESKDRVRAALQNSGFEFPARRITVNLAPADLPKDGGRFDLAIALGILVASGQLPATEGLEALEFVGELGLDGRLRAVRGALPTALGCAAAGRALVLPAANAAEAALPGACPLYPAEHLLAVCAHLGGREALSPCREPPPRPAEEAEHPDLRDVIGQAQAKRALEVAAAGGHHLLMIGPPGTGKSMLASRLSGLLPPLEPAEALESAAVWSISDEGFRAEHWGLRRFRAPHHGASAVALVGGGAQARPGEISLAHHGVLFLDELPEFDRRVLDMLREPLESGRVVIARAARRAAYPARFQLVAAMNPCPCGHLGDPRRACRCTPDQVARYRGRLSGPLLDRIDLRVWVGPPPAAALLEGGGDGESSAAVRARVTRCRARQLERAGVINARLEGEALRRHARLEDGARRVLQEAMERFALSARAHDRILRVARTLADLDEAARIGASHIGEALAYRLAETAPGPVQ